MLAPNALEKVSAMRVNLYVIANVWFTSRIFCKMAIFRPIPFVMCSWLETYIFIRQMQMDADGCRCIAALFVG